MTPPSADPVVQALEDALAHIDAGSLPSQLLDRARTAAADNDSRESVVVLSELFGSDDQAERLDPKDFIELARLARRFELDEVGAKVLERGTSLHGDEGNLQWEFFRFWSPLLLGPSVRTPQGSEALIGVEVGGDDYGLGGSKKNT